MLGPSTHRAGPILVVGARRRAVRPGLVGLAGLADLAGLPDVTR